MFSCAICRHAHGCLLLLHAEPSWYVVGSYPANRPVVASSSGQPARAQQQTARTHCQMLPELSAGGAAADASREHNTSTREGGQKWERGKACLHRPATSLFDIQKSREKKTAFDSMQQQEQPTLSHVDAYNKELRERGQSLAGGALMVPFMYAMSAPIGAHSSFGAIAAHLTSLGLSASFPATHATINSVWSCSSHTTPRQATSEDVRVWCV